MYYSHCKVSMVVVADDLVPNRHQGICSHYDDMLVSACQYNDCFDLHWGLHRVLSLWVEESINSKENNGLLAYYLLDQCLFYGWDLIYMFPVWSLLQVAVQTVGNFIGLIVVVFRMALWGNIVLEVFVIGLGNGLLPHGTIDQIISWSCAECSSLKETIYRITL